MSESFFPSIETAEARYIAIFGTRTRFVVMVLVLLCLTSIWSNILSLNMAVVCMDEQQEKMAKTDETFVALITHRQQSWSIFAVASAALLGNFPIVALIGRLGIRTVFALLGIISSISTALLPIAIQSGFPYLLVARVFQGIAFAANFPVIGSFCAKWAYFKQNGLFVSVLVAYVQLAPTFTNPASGFLCSSMKWQSIFYAHGIVSFLLFIVYFLFFRNNPKKHPFVGDVEVKKISMGKAATVSKAVPYKEILKTPAVWAVWAGAIGNFTCVNMEFLFAPAYLSNVLDFGTHDTGITSAIGPLAQFIVKIICGAISDRIKFISEVNKFRIFNTVAFFGSAAFLIALAFMNAEHKTLNMVLLNAAAAVLGATTGGFFKAGPVLSKQYSHFVTGNVSLGLSITMLIVPFIVQALTKHNTQDEWRWVFLITAGVLILTNIVFVMLVRGEPCEWTKDSNPSPVYTVYSASPASSARSSTRTITLV